MLTMSFGGLFSQLRSNIEKELSHRKWSKTISLKVFILCCKGIMNKEVRRDKNGRFALEKFVLKCLSRVVCLVFSESVGVKTPLCKSLLTNIVSNVFFLRNGPERDWKISRDNGVHSLALKFVGEKWDPKKILNFLWFFLQTEILLVSVEVLFLHNMIWTHEQNGWVYQTNWCGGENQCPFLYLFRLFHLLSDRNYFLW